MSDENCNYLVKFSGIEKQNVEVCPNSIKVNEPVTVDKREIRNMYELPTDKRIFVYGGNLGVAQGIDFIISCLNENEKSEGHYILIVGSGTEFQRLMGWFNEKKPTNCKIISALPQEKYSELMAACDVGLIFWDHRFTIPNFPSRLLSYMKEKKPVLAATDPCTDIGRIIEKGGFGYWCESNDVNGFINAMSRFDNDNENKKMVL